MSDVVDRAKTLLQGTTPGLWRIEYDSCACEGRCNCGEWPYLLHGPNVTHTLQNRSPEFIAQYGHSVESISDLRSPDAEIIAAAPTLIAELVTEVEHLRGATIDAERVELIAACLPSTVTLPLRLDWPARKRLVKEVLEAAQAVSSTQILRVRDAQAEDIDTDPDDHIPAQKIRG